MTSGKTAANRLALFAVLARLHARLQPLLARPLVRRALCWAGRLAVLAYFVFVVLILALRYYVLPQVASHQADIERAASVAIGMPVKIDRIEAGWQGLNPQLNLSGVRLVDRQGLPALTFEQVEGVLSWHSLWRFKPILALLVIDGPVLNVRRDTSGRITVAGVSAEGESDPRLAEWVFEQRRIRIRNAIIVWEDAKRKAPPLILEDLQFSLDNRGDRHSFGLSAVPPESLASRLDIRGDLRGNPLEGLERLSGRSYAELAYADLAGWRAWVDYPLPLQRGRGAVRVWADWQEGGGGITADLALEDVQVRLGRGLPELALNSMRGRLEGRYKRDDWQVAGQRVELSTLSGIRVPPSDFRVEWRPGKEGLSGAASTNFVDLEVLERLAAYLPLDARSRELLATHQPRGRITDMKASWELSGENLKRYALAARFEEMGMRAAGHFPGGSGLSGSIDANEKGGHVQLESKATTLDLPSVFPEPHLAFALLRGKANWKIDGKSVDARLEKLEFSGDDAAGSAQGSYRNNGEGPGVVDLTAKLERADGTAVWRYMPHSVNQDTRSWLKRGIAAGTASDARLTLKGDLRDFPFADKSKGEFSITAKVRDVRVDYAPGWPVIEGVEADLSFGVGMRVNASKGRILGTNLSSVVAELPDFDAAEEWLLIKGLVEGPTAEFLKYIVQSPVAGKINNMTDDMRASGNGRLALKLDMPLRHVVDTKVRGEYQFIDNQIVAVPGLPPIAQVNGRLDFNEDGVSAPEITGFVFGAPMKLAVKNDGEKVRVAMSGGAKASELRKLLDSPVFDYVSGQTTWKGEVRVRKKTTEFVIESTLQGISSSLPEPFNKTASATLPFHLEKTALPGVGQTGDQIRLSLRNIAEAQLIRRPQGDGMQVERGVAAIGDTLPVMPGKGIALAVKAPAFNGDFWLRLLAGGVSGEGRSSLSRVSLNTPALRLAGRDFHGVDVTATARDDGWQVAVNSREAVGELFWQTSGRGQLKIDLKRLTIPDETGPAATASADQVDFGQHLPGVDVRILDLTLGAKRLGRLDGKAHAGADAWILDSLLVQNPDGQLKGKGEWKWRGGTHTQLDFELTAKDVGKMLERFGHPNAVRSGNAVLTGKLGWDGVPYSLDYPSLTGEFSLHAEKGQFAKLEPGLGKLLGLISLQSLPRRLTLDFKDIFSEGLAFDSIDAKLNVRKGIMRTSEDLKIDGPSARILMKGETDLKNETQNVKVTVQPELGAVAAVGAAALAHPVIGAAALLASKILQNPLDRIFSFSYQIGGTWSDPKVEKTGQVVPTVPPGVEAAPAKPAAEQK